ncbi:hypothetical protein GCM10023332_13660 [Luteimonas vadosa]|uniref:Uncharacterized protein n=1 Tax=Luteimonas vadosa TaxID=1165507 RepID=A0ABP9DXR8_9GAMM
MVTRAIRALRVRACAGGIDSTRLASTTNQTIDEGKIGRGMDRSIARTGDSSR